MGFNNLPPQAYTRDMLSTAYEWLSTQPGSVRELATTADALVSLYLQSRRRQNVSGHASAFNNVAPGTNGANSTTNYDAHTGSSPNTPSNEPSILVNTQAPMTQRSAEAFKHDLKQLAEGLKQFEDPRTSSSATTSNVSHVSSQATQQTAAQQTAHVAQQTVAAHAALSAALAQQQVAVQQQQTVTQQQVQQQSQTSASSQSAHTPSQTTYYNPPISLPHLDAKSLACIREVQSRLNLGDGNDVLRMLISLGYDRVRTILPKE